MNPVVFMFCPNRNKAHPEFNGSKRCSNSICS